MPTRLLLIIFIVSPFFLMAQNVAETTQVGNAPVWFRAAYMGSVAYPGIKLGMEYPLKTKRYQNGSDSTKIIKVKERSMTGNLGWYHHKNYHDNFILTAGYLLRRTNSKGWFTDFEPQLGVSRTFIGGAVYTVDANNNVEQRKLAGDWFLASQLSFSVGKDLSYNLTKRLPLKIYLRPTLIVLLPYNNFIYVRPSIEIGTVYSFNNFCMVKSKNIFLKK